MTSEEIALRKRCYPSGLEFEEPVHCKVCDLAFEMPNVLFEKVPDLDTPAAPIFRIIQCNHCGAASTSPAPTASTIALLYSGSDSSDYEYPELGLIGKLKDMFARRRVRQIVSFLSFRPRTILDYGTGGGRFASAAAFALPGCQVTGTDFAPSPPSRSYYSQDSKITYASYREVQASPARYDLIIARHVLEHMHQPVEFLQSLLGLLSENGAVYVEVPNVDSRTARILEDRWPLLYVPRHLSHFNKATLLTLVQRANAQAVIGQCEIPMMGNVVAIKLHKSRFDPAFRPLAVLLFPLQLLLEGLSRQGTCLFAIVKPLRPGL